jgi:hypothetical protein
MDMAFHYWNLNVKANTKEKEKKEKRDNKQSINHHPEFAEA